MDIKQRDRRSLVADAVRRLKRERRLVVIVIYTLIVFVTGAAVHRSRIPQRGIAFTKRAVSMGPRMIRARMARPEHLTIDIKHDDYMALFAKRQHALALGVLISTDDDFVPAEIRHGAETVRVRLRLKGDLPDHWDTDRWSFRVQVRGEQSIFGMKHFSLQHPKTRNYLYEWMYFQLLRREGLIALRYDFIDVTVNGVKLGTYAVEEHFEKRLIENNRRREGPIVRFNEDLLWAELLHHRDLAMTGVEQRAGSGSYLASEIDVFQTNRWLADSTARSLDIKASNLLEGFRAETLAASDVFDVDALGRFIAVNDLFGRQHGANWRNIRFYYNPVTTRLEPIGFDVGGAERATRSAIMRADNPRLYAQQPAYDTRFWETLFGDPAVRRAYLSTIERLSEPDYLRSYFDSLAAEIETKLNIIRRSDPEVDASPSVLYGNAAYFRRLLYPVKRVHAHVTGVIGDSVELDVGNIQVMPLELTAVRIGGRNVELPAALSLAGRSGSARVAFTRLRVPLPHGVTWSDSVAQAVRVATIIPATHAVAEDPVFITPRPTGAVLVNGALRAKPNAAEFEFVRIDEASRSIRLLPGTRTIAKDLIVPAGYRFRAGDGVTLRLARGANLITYSPVEFMGAPDGPVTIESTDSSGGGFVVIGARDHSRLENVVFRNLGYPAEDGWTLTGAVTFYESPVQIFNTLFDGNRAEDALNTIRSDFHIENATFVRTPSDAFDSDFCEGTVTRSRFASIGNDAIDFSGSVGLVREVDLYGAGDKGVSVGENSTAYIVNSRFRRANVGVASKDLSRATVENVTISEGVFGFAAYRKKPEFGGGDLMATGSTLRGIRELYLRDAESDITVNGSRVGRPSTDVLRLIDPN